MAHVGRHRLAHTGAANPSKLRQKHHTNFSGFIEICCFSGVYGLSREIVM